MTSTVYMSPASTDYIEAPVAATQNGSPINPTGFPVDMAFILTGEPVSGDWHAAIWETSGSTYLAKILVGPAGGLALASATYSVWVRVQAAVETPIQKVGSLILADSATYTYLPVVTAKDQVRFLAGDTDPTRWQVSDEEILWMLNFTGGDAPRAAIRILLALASSYSRDADRRIGEFSISSSQKAASMRDQAKAIAETYGIDLASDAVVGVAPYVGGLSRSEEWSDLVDTDLKPGRFHRGMHDNPGNAGTGTSTMSPRVIQPPPP